MQTRPKTDKRRRLLVRWGAVSAVVTLFLTAIVIFASTRREEPVAAANANIEGLTSVLTRKVSGDEVRIRFEHITDSTGIDFRHMPGTRGSLLPEDMGSGVACSDFDGDGLTDLYLVNVSGNALPDAIMDSQAGGSRLYRNIDGTRFEDVTESAGVGFVGIGMGAAWGDFDNDADPDLYVTAYGDNALFRNEGNGRFTEIASEAGVQDKRFSTGCTWSDFDRDGDLDLYVCNYVDFVFRPQDRDAVERQYATEQPFTLNPSSYVAQPNSLFVNDGSGGFRDMAAEAGVADPGGRSLSASWTDLNNDGFVDLYVANDVSNNGVYLNRCSGGSISFDDVGAASLAADYRGAMGIAVADIDDDNDQDLLITHWIAQENALYRNMVHDAKLGDDSSGRLWFMDDADAFGLGQSSLDMVGWATGFADFDNDGRRDLWILNGSTIEQTADHTSLVPQSPLVFWNHVDHDMVEITRFASPELHTPAVHRGGAQLDIDEDGLIDLVALEHGGPARIFRNVTVSPGNYLRVHLGQEGANTAALGARVTVRINGTLQMAEVGASSSYLSQDERIVHFGIGESDRVDELEIVWPDGVRERHGDLKVNQLLRMTHVPRYANQDK